MLYLTVTKSSLASVGTSTPARLNLMSESDDQGFHGRQRAGNVSWRSGLRAGAEHARRKIHMMYDYGVISSKCRDGSLRLLLERACSITSV